MISRVFYVWRLLATGWCFFSFSLGGLLLALFVFPVFNFMNLFTREQNTSHKRAQAVIHHVFWFFMRQMEVLGILKMEVIGKEKLQNDRPKLVLANHPTLVDVVMLISILRHTNCVVKKALFRDPFLGGVVKAAGYINNDGTDAVIDVCVKALQDGDNLVIFPEGTRSVPGKEMKFQRGAAHIAARAGVDVVPVTITCDPPTLSKADKWYHIPPRPFHLRAEVGDTLDIAPLVTDEPSAIVSRRVTKFLHAYFTQRLNQFGLPRARA